MFVFTWDGEPRAFETLSPITSSTGFTSALLTNNDLPVKSVVVTAELADARFTLDGTTPTVATGTAAGHLLIEGNSFQVRGLEACRNFRVINDVASNGAVLKCTFFY